MAGLLDSKGATRRMTGWLPALDARWNKLKLHADWLVIRLKHRFNWLDEVKILPYRGHGTPDALYVRGRVLEKKGITPSTQTDPARRNVLNMYRRFSSNAIPNARVCARFQGAEFETCTDGNGFFNLRIEPEQPLDQSRVWHEVELALIEPVFEGQPPVEATAHVLVPPPSARFGVISDIDDTIVTTEATNLLKMLRLTLLNNAHTRLPFKGIAAFYQALQRGAGGKEYNPIFYVSSSPWNIYDLLVDFLDIHGLPVDPLFLRDWSQGSLRDHEAHKLEQIETIMATYPDLPFILIGDSGQEDPEIYQHIVADFPGRVLAVYIRDVSRSRRDREVEAIREDVCSRGIQMLLMEDTIAAAEHAVSHGFIRPDELPAIRADKARDDTPLPPLEELAVSLTGTLESSAAARK
jgi:phosphatidate phosphatase APP1